MGGKSDGRPKTATPRQAPRTPRTEPPKSTAQEKPAFCFAHVDREADERWAFNPTGEEALEIVAFIGEMGKNTWAQIEAMRTGGRNRHRKHHSQNVESLDPPAQKDFHRCHLGERFGHDVFRFRLDGEKRLWGFREGRVFHVVWWDPDHQVYATEPA